MKLSFIIASLSYDNGIKECVRSIQLAGEHNADVEIEIVCVFQGIQEKRQFADNYLKAYYTEEHGLSKARNYGVRVSKGDFLVFLDDHATVDKSFIDRFRKEQERSPADAYCGKMLDPVTFEPLTPCFQKRFTNVLSRSDFRYFMGSSHILSRKVIDLIGYYDERFGRGSRFFGAEESDMFFRMMNKGCVVRYVPEIIFYHSVFLHGDSLQVYQDSYAVSSMITKNMIADPLHSPLYLFICFSIISKSFIRLIQSCFIKQYYEKNNNLHYADIIKGTVAGMIGYLCD